MAVLLAVEILARNGRLRPPTWCLSLGTLLAVYLTLIVASPEPLTTRLIAMRDQIGYAVIAIYAFWVARSDTSWSTALGLTMWGGRLSASFGIVQWLLASHLPSQLLAPTDTVLFGYYGTDIARSNGLVGNTIVFGALMTLMYAVHLAGWLRAPNLAGLAWSGLFLIAILSTFSRIAIVGAVATFVLCVISVWARQHPERLAAAAIAGPSLLLGIMFAIGPMVMHSAGDSFIVRDLFLGGNLSVRGSNDGHIEDLRIAQDSFNAHPVTGTGIGTHSVDSVYGASHPTITDGAMWARLAEGGLLLAIPYAAFLILVIAACIRAARKPQSGWLAVGLAAYLAYEFVAASLVNSAFFGKVPFVITWVVAGLALGASYKSGESLAWHRPRRVAR
jgi:hypothetical protein